jgi:type II secretory pathway pseudopilin PulG
VTGANRRLSDAVRRWRSRTRGDRGTSLVELTVVLALMGVVTSMFTVGIVQVYRATNRTESMAITQTQLHLAFSRLDRQVRYASWIRQPVETGDHWYVEFLGRNPQTEQPWCSRLVLDKAARVLRVADWAPGGTPAAGNALASQVVIDGTAVFEVQQPGSQPFASPTPAAAGASFEPEHQRLRVRLATAVGDGANGGTAATDVTFSAPNTSRTTVTGPECTEGRPA